MNVPQSHIVLKTELALEIDAANDRREHQLLLERLSTIGNQELPQMLADTFNELVSPDEYWQIDQLEVELNLDSLDELTRAIKERLPSEIIKAVRKVVTKNHRANHRSEKQSQGFATDWLLYYLKSGCLPWNVTKELKLQKLQSLMDNMLSQNPEFVSILGNLFLAHPSALARFILYFSPKQFYHFLKGWHRIARKQPLPPFGEWLTVYQKIHNGPEGQRQQYWHKMLEEIPDHNSSQATRTKKVKDTGRGKEVSSMEKQSTPMDPIFIEGAGVALLHPFIPRLLTHLGLSKNGLITDSAQTAAVLYSLASGKSPEEEWQLVLPKILCGVEVSEVMLTTLLTEDQLSAGEEMIEAAIRHWSTLGNISVNGFRNSFLSRPGRLTPIGEGWLLEWEQAPYDMLLDQLPWQMSYIKMPWMHKVVRMNL